MAVSPFAAIRDHVLLQWANHIAQVDGELRARLTETLFMDVLAQVPDAWLLPEPGIPTPAEKRQGYVDYLSRRLAAASSFVEEAVRARAELI